MITGSYKKSLANRESKILKLQLEREPRDDDSWEGLSMTYQLLREIATAPGKTLTINVED